MLGAVGFQVVNKLFGRIVSDGFAGKHFVHLGYIHAEPGRKFGSCKTAFVEVCLQLFLFDYHCLPPIIFRAAFSAPHYTGGQNFIKIEPISKNFSKFFCMPNIIFF